VTGELIWFNISVMYSAICAAVAVDPCKLISAPAPLQPPADDLRARLERVIAEHCRSRTHQPSYCCAEDAVVYDRLLIRMLVDELSKPSTTTPGEGAAEAARLATDDIIKGWLWHMKEPDQERARVSIERYILNRFPPTEATQVAVEAAAKEIRAEFKRKFVIPTEGELIVIISRYCGTPAASDAEAGNAH